MNDIKNYEYEISDILDALKTMKYPSKNFLKNNDMQNTVTRYVNERVIEYTMQIAKDLLKHEIPLELISGAIGGLSVEKLKALKQCKKSIKQQKAGE